MALHANNPWMSIKHPLAVAMIMATVSTAFAGPAFVCSMARRKTRITLAKV